MTRRKRGIIRRGHSYIMRFDKVWNVDAAEGGSLMRFVNTSCKPNAKIVRWYSGRKWHLVYVATRRIRAGEAIMVDYGDVGWEGECKCWEENCAGRIVSKGTGSPLDKKKVGKRGISQLGDGRDANGVEKERETGEEGGWKTKWGGLRTGFERSSVGFLERAKVQPAMEGTRCFVVEGEDGIQMVMCTGKDNHPRQNVLDSFRWWDKLIEGDGEEEGIHPGA
mmetsp:Transcript_67583/g.140876  ORF Transcript_67583/g.140876 Transcript_67583/m.140876 type:complete len:222 (+) Transcript_67583:313-978(+)